MSPQTVMLMEALWAGNAHISILLRVNYCTVQAGGVWWFPSGASIQWGAQHQSVLTSWTVNSGSGYVGLDDGSPCHWAHAQPPHSAAKVSQWAHCAWNWGTRGEKLADTCWPSHPVGLVVCHIFCSGCSLRGMNTVQRSSHFEPKSIESLCLFSSKIML